MNDTSRFVAIAAALVTLVCAALGWVWFHWSYFDTDSGSYLFQAMLFARGRLSVPSPPDLGLAPSASFNIIHGQWYAKSAWGNAAALALGVLGGVPWLVPAAETGITLIVMHAVLQRVYDPKTALAGVFLMLVSPAMIVIGTVWTSEATSRLALAIYLLGLAEVVAAWRRVEPARPVSAAMVGAGLGAALCTRPLTAVAFGVPGAVFLLWTAGRSVVGARVSAGRTLSESAATSGSAATAGDGDAASANVRSPAREIARSLASAVIPFLVFVGSLLAFNAALTGRALSFTQTSEQPYDGIGFGPRGGGYFTQYVHPAIYTPRAAISRTFRHVIPAISFSTVGWGYYRPELFNAVGGTVEQPVGGLEIKSRSTGDWIVLAVRGASNGCRRVTLDASRGGRVESWGTVLLPGCHSAAELGLRLAASREGYQAFFKRPILDDRDWPVVGTVPWALDGPVDVGPIAPRVSTRDPVTLTYGRFFAEGPDAGGLASDPLVHGPGRMWRWNRQPFEWSGAPSGVRIVADLHHSLHTDEAQPARLGDSVNHLYQTTAGRAFVAQVSLDAAWGWRDRFVWPRTALLAVVPLLAGVALLLGRSEWDRLLFSFVICSLALYGLFYFEGSTVGKTPMHVRYHNEATVLAVLPLVARGLVLLGSRLYGWRSPWRQVAVAAMAIVLSLNTWATYVAIGRDLQNWNDVYQQLPRLVARAGLHHAVVFLPHTHVGPLGDYPFEPLDRAGIVYYRLGPATEWGLAGRPWQDVYREYFKGRRAFWYEFEELRELDPPQP